MTDLPEETSAPALELPAISLDEAKTRVATKVHPRVSEETITAKIADVSYIHFDDVEDATGTPVGTLCIITMANGWISTGFSAPADPRNFDQDVGKRYAYENAFKPLWQLEGYLLKDTLARAQATTTDSPPAPLQEDI